jgi:hypothetical protein
LDDDGIGSLLRHLAEYGFELLGVSNHFRVDRRSDGDAAIADVFDKELRKRSGANTTAWPDSALAVQRARWFIYVLFK